jgi:Domain of unknown function (DUF4175)
VVSQAQDSSGASAIAGRLRSLERRRRLLGALRALGAWIAVVLPAAGLFCFVDWYQHMPLPARWVGLLALVAGAVFAFRKLVLPALRSRRSIDGSALSVESSFPELADGVITAVQLERRWGEFGYGSDEMRRAAQGQAIAQAASIDFGGAEPLSRYCGPMLLGAVALLLAGAATASFPRIVGIWAVRCFWTVEYPHKTRIEDYDREVLVARGEAATVRVRGGGIIPSGGVLRIRSKGSGWSTRQLLPPENAGRGEFQARVEEVVEAMEFEVELNDAPRVGGWIRVTDRPEVAAVAVRTSYPAYTGLPDETFMSGHIRAVPGSGVTITITPSKPLKSALLVFNDSSELRDSETSEKVSGSKMASGGTLELSTDGTALSASFTMRSSGSYSVHLIDREGFSNSSEVRAPVSYKISAVPDAPPRVTLVKPGAEALATPVSIVKLVYRISDDYGLRRARLFFRKNEKQAWQGIPLPVPGINARKPDADIAPPGPRRADHALLWDISTLGFKVGDMITYRLEADDHAPRAPAKPGMTGEQIIRIVSQEVIIKKLREDLEVTAKEIEKVFLLEKDSHERIRKLVEEIKKLKGK